MNAITRFGRVTVFFAVGVCLRVLLGAPSPSDDVDRGLRTDATPVGRPVAPPEGDLAHTPLMPSIEGEGHDAGGRSSEGADTTTSAVPHKGEPAKTVSTEGRSGHALVTRPLCLTQRRFREWVAASSDAPSALIEPEPSIRRRAFNGPGSRRDPLAAADAEAIAYRCDGSYEVLARTLPALWDADTRMYVGFLVGPQRAQEVDDAVIEAARHRMDEDEIRLRRVEFAAWNALAGKPRCSPQAPTYGSEALAVVVERRGICVVTAGESGDLYTQIRELEAAFAEADERMRATLR